jgi:hypothetical protein
LLKQDYPKIIKQSQEHAFYIMQTLAIGGEEVLTFYDSGSNGNLIEGALAEDLNFDVLDSRCVPVGVLGGGTVWTSYGLYSCVLGPDVEGNFHQMEMQGIDKITGSYPPVNLQPLWAEAKAALPGKRWPSNIGGDSVRMLIGIKSTRIFPKHILTLPNGLNVYESVFMDKYGSYFCFGGPHEIFTKAYEKHGMGSNHLQIMFTREAEAYLRSPRLFVADEPDSHGPGKESLHSIMVEELLQEDEISSSGISVSSLQGKRYGISGGGSSTLETNFVLSGGCRSSVAFPVDSAPTSIGEGDPGE